MRKVVAVAFCLVLMMAAPTRSYAIFGIGETAVLSKILIQAIQQLAQLRQILSAGKQNLALIKDINRGINDSLRALQEIHPNLDPGVYREWQNVNGALSQLEDIYGGVIQSPEYRVQKDMDQSIAEAVTFNNSYYDYSKQLDAIAIRIKQASHDVSPGGAQKLTAQALGLVLQVLNQNLRAQATALKLQAQGLAVRNRREKQETKHLIDSGRGLKQMMKNEKIEFKVPRF